ncbi:hypothetical protein ACERII_16855 [Evansella sp. AB-rgal1]|uniref:hypothetical protein n=1 Tax=Evansella sp. AB-rgal1 TaxID=3242696 RepID=UPI00359D853C
MKQGIAAVFMMIVMGLVLLLGCSTSNSEEATEEYTNETGEHDTNVDVDISEEKNEASGSENENNQDIEHDVGEDQTTEDAVDNPSEETTNNDEVVEEGNGEDISDQNSQDVLVDDAEKELILEMTEAFYTYLQDGQFEESIKFMNPDYLEYLGMTERDYINLYKDNQTLYDWKVDEFSIRTVDKVSLDVHVPEVIEPLIHSSETYIVIVDLRVSFYGESSGAVEYVVHSVTEDDEWKIFGIVSY